MQEPTNKINLIDWKSALSPSAAAVLAPALVCLLYIFVRWQFVQTWATNDDVGLSLISSGNGWASSPDAHLMFTNIAIGFILSQLYLLTSHVPWYGYYMVAVNLLALIGLSYSLLIGRSIQAGLFAVGILFCIIGLPNLCAMQFTTNSAILGLAGFAVIVAWWEQQMEKPDRLSFNEPILGSLIMVISSLVRYQSFLMMFVLGTLFFVIRIAPDLKQLTNNKNLTALKTLLVSAAVTFIVATVAYQANIWSYGHTKGWSDFYRANTLLANFVDFGFGSDCSPTSRVTAEQAAGWSDNDLSMLQNLFCFNTDIYSTEKMETVSNHLRGTRVSSVQGIFTELRTDLESMPLRPFIYISVFLFIFPQNRSFRYWQSLLLLISILGISIVLMVCFKLAPHVYKAIAAFWIFIPLFYFHRPVINPMPRWRKALTMASCLIITGILGFQAVVNCQTLSQNVMVRNAEFRAALKLLRRDKPLLLLTWREFFPYERILPFDNLSQNFGNIRILPLAFRADSALTLKTMELCNMTLSQFSEKLLQSNTYLVSAPDLNILMQKHLKEHYKLDVDITVAQSGQTVVPLYAVHRSKTVSLAP